MPGVDNENVGAARRGVMELGRPTGQSVTTVTSPHRAARPPRRRHRQHEHKRRQLESESDLVSTMTIENFALFSVNERKEMRKRAKRTNKREKRH